MSSAMTDSIRKRRRSVAREFEVFSMQHDEAMQSITNVWDKMGLTDLQQGDRMHQFYGHLIELLKDMSNEEEVLYLSLVKKVDKYREQVAVLESELGCASTFQASEGTILDVELELKRERDRLVSVKNRRVETITELRDIQNTLCQWLDCKQLIVPSGVPSVEQIAQLQTYVEGLVTEKESRLRSYRDLKQEILEYLKKLKKETPNEFLLQLAHSTEDSFDFSKANLQLLESHRDQLKVEYEFHLSQLTTKIEALKCELTSWWDLCCVQDEERRGLAFLDQENFSEQAFEIYQSELDRIKSHYKARKELYDTVAMWCEQWEEKTAFDLKPRQSYGDRGGALQNKLKRQRHIEISLPRLAHTLESLACKWNATHPQNNFLIFGMSPSEFIQYKNEEYLQKKEDLRKAKKNNGPGKFPSPKSKSRNNSPQKSSARNVGPPSTLHKRNTYCTHSTSPAKALSRAGQSPIRSPRKGIQAWVKKKENTPNRTENDEQGDELHPLPQDYENFTTPLHSNPNMRSSQAEAGRFGFHASPSKRLRFED